MSQPSGQEKDNYSHPDIFHFIALGGHEPRRWVEEYRGTRADELEQITESALLLLRRQEMEEGHALLKHAADLLYSKQKVSASILHVLERWYYSVLAFYHFRKSEFDPAAEALDRAHDSVSAAIGLKPFLLPLALHCMDFRFQRARIARSKRQWKAMDHHIQIARGILNGTVPFCTVADGTPIYISSLCEFYESIHLNQKERDSLRGVLDEKYRLDLYEQTVRRTYALLGAVIPYR